MGVSGVHVRVTSKDLGLRKIMEALKHDVRLKVGVVGDKAGESHGDGLTNAELAAIHEFGAPAAGIPERSFLRDTLDARRAFYLKDFIPRLLRAVIAQRITMSQAFGLLGERMVADVKERITSGTGIPPELKPATIAAKGSDRPLVDTGRLLAAISYEIRIVSA